MIDLYYAPTANGFRASVALEECGLAWRPHPVDLYRGEQQAAAFLGINPLGAIPVIVDHEGPGGKPITLTQSSAILLYAAEKSGRHIPADPARRAVAMQWLMLAASDVGGANVTINQLVRSAPQKSQANLDFFQGRLLKYLGACDQRLDGREYLADELSVADLALYPYVAARRELIDSQMNGAGQLKNLQRWADGMALRPAIARAMRA